MKRNQRIAEWVALVAIAFAVLGAAIGYLDFSKIRIGPFYIFELFFLIWLASALMMPFRRTLLTFCRFSYPTLLFLAWGLALIICNVAVCYFYKNAIPFSRIAQHAIIIFYPAMWTLVGYWCFITNRTFTRFLAYALVIGNAAPNLYGHNITNIAAGPLISLPYIFLLYRMHWNRQNLLLSIGQWLLIAVLGYFAFLPFWRMWATAMQRTSLLILFSTLIVSPWLLKSTNESPWRCIETSFLSLGYFAFGLIVYFSWTTHQPVTSEQKLVAPILTSTVTVLGAPTASTSLSPSPSALAVVAPEPTAQSFAGHTRPTVMSTPTLQMTTPSRTIKYQDIYNSFLHGEDRGGPKGFGLPMMRTRRYMWMSALADWRLHPITGIGFVSEVPREVAPGLINNGGFQTQHSPPISGPHNSYLSILARTGLVGFFLFVWMILHYVQQAKMVYQRTQPISLFELLIFMVPLNGALHGLVNVGFESPPRALLMWFFLGVLLAVYARLSIEPCEF